MPGDPDATLRALRRAVYVHKTLRLEDAWKVLDLHGIQRRRLDEADT